MSLVKMLTFAWPIWLQSRRRRFALFAILGAAGWVLYGQIRPARLQPHVWVKELSSDRSPQTLTICPQHGYLVEVLRLQHQVAILDAVSGRELAILGVRDEAGDDQRHFRYPYGATCDEKRGRIVVSEPVPRRLQIFDIDSFAHRESLATPVALNDLTMDAKGDRIFAIASYDETLRVGGNVWILDGATLVPTGREVGIHKRYGDFVTGNTLNDPQRVVIDNARGRLLVLDYGDFYTQNQVLVFNLSTLVRVATIGSFADSFRIAGEEDDPHPLKPTSIAIDDATGHILVADTFSDNVQILDGNRFTYVDKIDGQKSFTPTGIATYKGLIFIKRNGKWIWSEARSSPDHIDLYGPFINRNLTR